MLEILVSYDEEKGITEDIVKTLVAMMTKVCLLSRAVVGTDELTGESINLFSSKSDYEKLASLEIEELKKRYEDANT
jgi:hypothetical protein